MLTHPDSRILSFHFVDVFARRPLEGNPLAVVDGGDELPDDILRKIAREFNQSETTFLLRPTLPGADYRLRSFTAAGVEVNGAGHNALGAWWWLASAGRLELRRGRTDFQQQIGGVVLPLYVSSDGAVCESITMQQEAPRFLAIIEDAEALASALGISKAAISISRLPCQVVWTGTPHLMVPLADRSMVDALVVDQKALAAVLHGVSAEGCYVFAVEDPASGAHAYARFFNPTVGLWEDPATGTAAGPLAALLVENGVCEPGRIVVEQGTAMGRRSHLAVEICGAAVAISGSGTVTASGRILTG